MSKVDMLLEAEAKAQADIDEMYEERANICSARISQLLSNTMERNHDIFALLDASVSSSLDEWFAIPVFDRDITWSVSLSSLVVACRVQTWIEVFGLDALSLYENNGVLIDSMRRDMTRDELISAALLGIGKNRIDAEKEKRKKESSQ